MLRAYPLYNYSLPAGNNPPRSVSRSWIHPLRATSSWCNAKKKKPTTGTPPDIANKDTLFFSCATHLCVPSASTSFKCVLQCPDCPVLSAICVSSVLAQVRDTFYVLRNKRSMVLSKKTPNIANPYPKYLQPKIDLTNLGIVYGNNWIIPSAIASLPLPRHSHDDFSGISRNTRGSIRSRLDTPVPKNNQVLQQ